ncbi:MAG: hypothetical protein VKK98_05255 [Cyanobacteriota bacterium]|nr:hypothetical protein [Cyanobacteriota bacterium]
MTFAGLCEAGPIVLCATGPASSVSALLREALPLLARELALEPLPALAPIQQADLCLSALRTGGPSAALAPLPADPGMTLEDGRCWARALAAWARPCIILIDSEQLQTGTAAASTALMAQHGVPLLGLIQWGGIWQAPQRRLDGLPWLGAAGPGEARDPTALRLTLALRAARRVECGAEAQGESRCAGGQSGGPADALM